MSKPVSTLHQHSYILVHQWAKRPFGMYISKLKLGTRKRKHFAPEFDRILHTISYTKGIHARQQQYNFQNKVYILRNRVNIQHLGGIVGLQNG